MTTYRVHTREIVYTDYIVRGVSSPEEAKEMVFEHPMDCFETEDVDGEDFVVLDVDFEEDDDVPEEEE